MKWCIAETTTPTSIAHRGNVMSPAEFVTRYRDYAANCVKIAQEISDAVGKLSLLNMAQAWIALADQAEKNGGNVLFCETPLAPPNNAQES
jgi:hypothetical protein